MSYLNRSTFENSSILRTFAKKRQRTFFSELVTAIRPGVLGKDT